MKDDWLHVAISDDNIVADLLLLLKSSPSPPQQPPYNHRFRCFPRWGLRLPRSKQPLQQHAQQQQQKQKQKQEEVKYESDTRRCSPTTPFDWSNHIDDCDYSGCSGSLPTPSDRFRSKVSGSTETPTTTTTTTTTTNKRPRRKKTFGELKEEENSLLKERMCLEKELATLRESIKEQRSINQNLKRMKIDLHVESREIKSVDEHNNTSNGVSEAGSSSVDKTEDATSQEQLFVLPDLNMVPEEDTH